MLISFVIPAKDEQGTIAPLADKIIDVTSDSGHEVEIIFIDDGSTDSTWDVLTTIAEKNPEYIKAIKLRRNFGKATALAAGFEACNGEIVFTIDADLQDDPKEIPLFLEKLSEGYDVVSGWKKIRNDPLSKVIPSRIYNWVTSRVTGLKLHDFNCGFKAYRKEVVDKIRIYGELHRYIPVLAHDIGYKVTEIPINHHPRTAGKSKYGFERYGRGLVDLITVYSTTQYLQRPGHLFGGIGMIAGLLGFMILGYLAILWLLHQGPIGTRPLFFVGVMLVILSVQMISLGVIAELMNKNTDNRTSDTIISSRINITTDN